LFDLAEPGGEVRVGITFEVWNRRKYPIGLGYILLEFQHERSDIDGLMPKWEWYGDGRKFDLDASGVIEANSRERYEFGATFKAISGEEFHDHYCIVVNCYDVKRNGQRKVQKQDRFDLRALHTPVGARDTG
jgi:hypothetical protein